MKKWIFSSVAVLFAGSASLSLAVEDSFHKDYRHTPKIKYVDDYVNKSVSKAEDLAKLYLESNWKQFRLSEGLADLKLAKVKHSLLATHVIFDQYVNDVPVRFAQVIVSVKPETGEVTRVFNNYFPANAGVATESKSTISKESAYDIAWQDLRVHGKLHAEPKASKAYQVDADGNFTLVYITELHVQAPFGAWEHVIDANSGELVEVKDTRIERIASKTHLLRGTYQGQVWDRRATFADFANEKSSKETASKSKAAPSRADGMATVFDPDPETTLMVGNFEDNTAAGEFEDAYFQRQLLDLTLEDGVYKLVGPWVQIKDFESPTSAPSTSVDGNWPQKRGDVAFNDAMTYFHVDQNQRYMQSLGFVDEKGIQSVSIEVDANGVNGADNSHFIPGSNRMAFGHGCVDDNEDADVILHEYGHAIHHSINENWRGGDTGAMGEGFGDYWAGSYSISTTNGLDFNVNNVFSWDGHNDCWPGRKMDTVAAMYNHDRSYGAHARVDGFITDELWSTPLFQSLLELLDQNVPREEVDQIILEAHFGLGANLKMRDLANSILAAASQLYPDGPHAAVFKDKFSAQQIIEDPRARMNPSVVELMDAGDNGVADPGETVSLMLRVSNDGTLMAKDIMATLSSPTEGVQIAQASSAYPEIAIGSNAVNETPFQVSVPATFACGDKVALELQLTLDGGSTTSASLEFELGTGVAEGFTVSLNPGLAIPDNDSTGVTSVISVEAEDDAMVTDNFNVDIEITHTYISDLNVTLTSPDGTTVALHANSGGSNSNIVGNYPANLNPAGNLADFEGDSVAGDWMLKIVDSAGQDTGDLVEWGLNDVSGYTCQ